jgi:hypothetical protein
MAVTSYVGRGRSRTTDGGGRLGASVLLDCLPVCVRIVTVRHAATHALTGIQVELLLKQVRVRRHRLRERGKRKRVRNR